MARADAIHVRCPGNLGLLAVIFGPLFSRRLICKYAGQWTGYPGEALTYRLTRWLLKSPWWRGPVTVYGRHPDQPPQVVPFFTSIMNDAQMDRARAATARLASTGAGQGPLRIVYVGRLSRPKNVDVLLQAAARLHQESIPVRVTIIGEGPEREPLEKLAAAVGVAANVTFTGGVSGDSVFDFLEKSDVSVLVSMSEGWPKALTESMSFGLYCIASDRGLMPEFLGEGRGAIVPTRDVDALAEALRFAATHPNECLEARRKAAAWAQQYSLSGLREALRRLLNERWGQHGTSGLEPAPKKKPA
jgi:glycosyltransferase involved in cell wall biosynthesis